MSRRNRWFITSALACHLLLACGVVTNGFRLHAQEATSLAAPHATGAAAGSNIATIRAKTQEKNGDLYSLHGEAEVDYKNLIFRSDEATYNDTTGDVTATGNITLDGGLYDEHITASHALYNIRTLKGKFYDVAGTLGYKLTGKGVTLTSSSPFFFTGKEVDKEGEDRYVIHHGTVTSCELPHPKWTFSAVRIVVDVGETAQIYSSSFAIKKIPVFYFPYARHPVEKLPRESGFLIPSFGTSSRKGFILGDAFYWAINRSMDATIGAELWSSRGWAQHGEFRARPTESSYVQFNYFGVLDRGISNRNLDQSGEDIHLNANDLFTPNTRGVVSIEYLSSYIFRQGFAETFSQAINSEVNSAAFVSRNQNGYFLNLMASRYQDFQSNLPNDVVTIQHLPAFDASTPDRSIAGSRFFWSFDGEAGGVSRSEPTFKTPDLVGRFDVQPRLAFSWVGGGWTLRPEIALRDTFYTGERLPGVGIGIGTTASVAANRKAFEGSFELRPPALARIFNKPVWNHRIKHSIEPRLIYNYVQGISNFGEIIRFDERDILSDTNEFQVGLINRLYAKAIRPECEQASENLRAATLVSTTSDCADATPREILTWELGQKMFLNRDFGGALVPGRRNVFTSTDEFSGIAFLTDARRLSPVISRMRIFPNLRSSLEWDLDYDMKKGHIASSTTFADYRIGDVFFGAGHTYLVTPGEIVSPTPIVTPSLFNQFRLTTGYGNANKRGVTSAATVGFDVKSHFIQYAALQTTYNWDCCGVTVEYRRLALGALRNENQFRFAFTLANVGTFGNLRRQERIY